LPDGARRQISYCIDAAGTEFGEVRSGGHLLVPWPGAPVPSHRRVEWRVKVTTEAGESDWSTPAWFEPGLLDSADWSARWIEPHEDERSAHILRNAFSLEQPAASARLYATAHGIYETFLNGRRVGDHELTPGYTFYPATLHVQVYDVTGLLIAGRNVWEVILTDGWYRGRIGSQQTLDGYGDRLAFLAQLHAGDVVVGTGPGWESSTGRILTADLMAGQQEDRRRAVGDWRPVAVVDRPLTGLTYSPAPPTRRTKTVRPRSVRRPKPDRQVVDLGQNINGWVRLTELGPAGTELRLVHGEALDAAGDVTQDHLAAFDNTGGTTMLPVGQIDRVISGGRDGDVFEPRHTTHGFRFVRIEGHPRRLVPDDITGVVVHTDLSRTGWFACSDDDLNRLHDAAEWSFLDNACEIPTDCPQRERAGWTGDWQIFAPSAAFLFDVAGFTTKWVRDVASQQFPDGCITNQAPDPRAGNGGTPRPESIWPYLEGSAGWGDAIVLVPWEMWRQYGDLDLLAEMWKHMAAWVDFAAAAARDKRHPSRTVARPEPEPHEEYLWDGGFHWGEWIEPGSEHDDVAAFAYADQGSVATAYLHRSSSLVGRIGRLLGRDAEAARFERLSASALDAWRQEFIGADGSLTPDTQANHVRALAFGLVPEELRTKTAERLVALIREAGTHLGTGFLATPYLLPVLADSGHLDLAYELLHQDTPPSWLTMVRRGATTIWEHWEGVDEEGAAHGSLNHYSKGAVISFLHRYVAGIDLLDEQPGYRRFRVAPRPGGGLTWAQAGHDSPYGRIESSWRLDGEDLTVTVTVPAGTAAEVELPDGTRRKQLPGTETHRSACAGVGNVR
jgi:alpha-L-rhamnosidase